MSEEKRWQFELEEYIIQGEPEQVEKSEAWKTAIGLQAVDGLKTSEYLLDTAKEHIEGRINIDEAQKRIQSYYENRDERMQTEDETREADIVSARIAKHLAKFASDIWQIHPFCEGNTRATAVFMIKYMKTLGFEVNIDAFEKRSACNDKVFGNVF